MLAMDGKSRCCVEIEDTRLHLILIIAAHPYTVDIRQCQAIVPWVMVVDSVPE